MIYGGNEKAPTQLNLNQNENFGPEYNRMFFQERGGFGNEIFTIRLGTQWLDPTLVSQTIQCMAGPTKQEAEDQGVYIVQSISLMSMKHVPNAVYKKLTGNCKGASPLKVRELMDYFYEGTEELSRASAGTGHITSDSHVTVLHLVKFK